MIFNSIDFLIFVTIFFILWPLFRKHNTSRWLLIVVASFIFYAWWDWRFLFLIIGSGLIDYIAGWGIKKWSKFRTPLLAFSLIVNLGALVIFKYSEFIAVFIHDLLIKVGINVNLIDNIPEFALILPVGISFYTFQSLSYTIDIYRGRLTPTKNILHFFAYLSMFPQLVAGPIIRAKDFLKQLNTYKIPNSQAVWHGVKLIIYGLFQKMVIADNLSLLIDSAYEGVAVFDGSIYWWVIVVAFSFQIYCDFSGYSLIARGLAKLMGYQFKMNFNHPYLSSSFKSFWNNWHISLSTWFRDYVYIPIGGSKNGVLYGSLALLITFFLSGIWHGASYNFIVWAGLHVTFLLLERVIKQITKQFEKQKLLSFITLPLVFISSTIAWVYFRSDDVAQANEIVKKLFAGHSSNPEFWETYKNNIFFLKLAIVVELLILLSRKVSSIKILFTKYNLDVVTVTISIIAILFLRGEGEQFIYFQF